MRAVGLVAGRELRETLRSRAYWISLGTLVLVSLAMAALPALLSDPRYGLAVVGEHPAGLEGDLTTAATRSEVGLRVFFLADDADAEEALERGAVDAALVFEADGTVLMRRWDTSEELVRLAEDGTATAAARSTLLGEGLADDTVTRALTVAPLSEVVVDEDQRGRDLVGLLIGVLLLVALMLGGTSVANAVATEKSTRVAEVLVTTVRPARLLAGKVLGIGLSTLLLLLAVSVPFVGAFAVRAIAAPSAALLDVLGGLGWFLLGYAIYAVGFAALGALVDRQEDLIPATAPLTFMLVLTLVAAILATDRPEGGLAVAASLFPLSAPVVMPIRIAEGAASAFEVAAAVLLGVATLLVFARLGGTIYQRALLRGGRRLRVTDVLRG